jgi:glycosyltransferase involved in cell wall biosynthesis
MRILVFNYAYDAGFADPADLLNRYTTLTGWSDAVLEAGASAVTVVLLFRSDARVERNGVAYFFCGDRSSGWKRRLRRVVLEQNPDVVHINGLMFPSQTWRLRRELPAGTAIVVQDHGGAEPSRHPIRLLKHRMGMRAADAFLFSAVELAQPWKTAGIIGGEQLVYPIMESSTPMRPLPRDQARTMSAVPGSPALLWVGRLNANKDPMTVLDGFERALNALPDAHLTMVYHSEECLPQVQTRIARSVPLGNRVHLRGHIEHQQLAAFYSAADLFVLGSHHEGSGYALIEALACGTFPVVTNIPSFRALTGNGAFGALWSPGDAAGFADALIRCGKKDVTALRCSILRHFESSWSWPAIGRCALAAYAEVSLHRAKRLVGRSGK